jgi:UPF0716 protein FxsA
MPLILILIFPLAEIAAFIMVGREIGVFATLGLIVVSSLLGLGLLREAGILTAMRLQRREGNPATVLAEGGVRMLAGLLLFIPGFLTDIAAVAVLLPSVRRYALRFIGRKTAGASVQHPEIIDGDFRRIDR